MKLILLFLLMTTHSFTQTIEIGVNAGFGLEKFVNDGKNILTLNSFKNNETRNYSRVGINYFYTPQKAFFTFKAGLTFDNINNTSSQLNFIRIPVGLDLFFGKKIQPIFGCAMYTSILINSFGFTDSDFINTKKTNQFGANFNLGIGYQVNHKYNVSLTYQNNIDLTPLYYDTHTSSGGQSYLLDVKGFDGFLNLSIKVKFRETVTTKK